MFIPGSAGIRVTRNLREFALIWPSCESHRTVIEKKFAMGHSRGPPESPRLHFTGERDVLGSQIRFEDMA